MGTDAGIAIIPTNITNCYCQELYGSQYGTILTREQMHKQSSFAGFNFNKTWSINPDINDGYPYLSAFGLSLRRQHAMMAR